MNDSHGQAAQSDPPVYHIPPGVEPVHAGRRVLLTTPLGGRVVLDRIMLQIWQCADGRSSQEILTYFEEKGLQTGAVSAALACLAAAGLLLFPKETLEDLPAHLPNESDALVSVIIVSYNSLAWLPGCLASLRAQTHSPLEIIAIDNSSSDGSADWIARHHPDLTLVRLDRVCSLAAAINQGIKSARGEYLLLLNPDVVLEQQAVSHLLQVARSDENIAAVASKLRLMWAPAFLNGLGNLVGSLSWGTDIALGHLDLGQFDHWSELPSACFAAALLSARKLAAIGLLDEGLPMYYEDSEWCYRARLFGFTVRLAPQAIADHAFSSRVPDGTGGGLSPEKLQRVIYGRLRFITRLLGPAFFFRFIIGYIMEDLLKALLYLLRGRWGHLRTSWRAWADYFRSLNQLRSDRKILQSRRAQTDQDLFSLQRQLPVPQVWRGLPLLCLDIVQHEYQPWLESRQVIRPRMTLPRALSIWRIEGGAALMHRLGRQILWKLMQP